LTAPPRTINPRPTCWHLISLPYFEGLCRPRRTLACAACTRRLWDAAGRLPPANAVADPPPPLISPRGAAPRRPPTPLHIALSCSLKGVIVAALPTPFSSPNRTARDTAPFPLASCPTHPSESHRRRQNWSHHHSLFPTMVSSIYACSPSAWWSISHSPPPPRVVGPLLCQLGPPEKHRHVRAEAVAAIFPPFTVSSARTQLFFDLRSPPHPSHVPGALGPYRHH
jgi:hypothetical protein